MQETFSNILNNAIEAIGSDGEIKIDIFENNKFVTVAVKDNGPGISKENLPRIIDPFFLTKNRTQNFGLVLSYCYSVMQQHGGALEQGGDLNTVADLLGHAQPSTSLNMYGHSVDDRKRKMMLAFNNI